MDARGYIDKHIDGRRLLEYYNFDSIDDSRTTIRACCKLHNGDNTHGFTFDTETLMWHCHTGGCGGGDAYQLIMTIEDINYPQSIMRMAEIFNVDITNLALTTIKSANKKEQDEWLKLIKKKQQEKEVKPYILPDLEIKPVKKFRSFANVTLEHFELGYVESFPALNSKQEPYTLFKRLLIPVHFKSELIGATLRRIRQEDMQKWSHQGFDSGVVLYNYDGCLKYLEEHPECEEIVCVEGCFDVWSFWEQGIYNVVATFGAHITSKQIELLQSLCTMLILAYDGDKAGRENTVKVIGELKRKFDLYIMPFAEGEDPGNQGDLIERYKSKIYYTRW